MHPLYTFPMGVMQSFQAKAFFHWKFSGVLIPFLWGTGLAMIGLGVALDALTWMFILAYVFFVAAFLWSIGYWLTSETLKKKKTNRNRAQRRQNKNNHGYHSYYYWEWSIVGGLVLILIISLTATFKISLIKELSKLEGILLPANDTISILNPCRQIPAGAMTVYVGNSVMYSSKPSFNVLTVKDQPLLSINKLSDGNIALSAIVKGSDGKIITSIKDSQFVVNPNNILRMKRSDRSSLVVEDQYGNVAIDVRYMNPTTIRIYGQLFYGSRLALVMQKEQFSFGGNQFSQMCFGEMPTGIAIN